MPADIKLRQNNSRQLKSTSFVSHYGQEIIAVFYVIHLQLILQGTEQ